MTAQDRLSPDQFPIEAIHDMYSSDFDSKMTSVGPMLRSEYAGHLRGEGGDVHPQDIEHGGPDKYVAHLAKDIAANGMQKPIKIRNGNVLTDGNHRYLAAVKAGLTHVPVEHSR